MGSLGWTDKLPGELGKLPKVVVASLSPTPHLCVCFSVPFSFICCTWKSVRTSGSSVSGANSRDFVQGHPNLPEI